MRRMGRDREVDGRARKGEGKETRRGHGTTLLNVVPPVLAVGSKTDLESRALCPVLVGISGAPTGPIRVPCVSDHLRAGPGRATE